LKCKICARKASDGEYCKFHARAYKNVAQNYEAWKKARGISWKEYLSEIANNPLTGQWAKETAQQSVNAGEKENVTQS
jgi:hypothetical protein